MLLPLLCTTIYGSGTITYSVLPYNRVLEYKPPTLVNPKYIDFRPPAKYDYDMQAGEKVYVPFGYGTNSTTLFGVAGMNVVELTNGITTLSSTHVTTAKYIFAPQSVHITAKMPQTQDYLIRFFNKTGRGMNIRGGNNVHVLGGDITVTQNGSISGSDARGTIRVYDQKSSVIIEGLHINNNGVVNTGTVQAATSNTITLPSTADAVDNFYVGMTVSFIASSGTVNKTGAIVTGYNGTTKVISISGSWPVTPPVGTLYVIGYYGWDGIEFGNGADAEDDNNQEYLPDIYILNCHIKDVFSMDTHPLYPNLHADFIQFYGKCRFLFIDGLSGTTWFQGMFLDPQHWCYDTFYKNLTLEYGDPTFLNNAFIGYFHFASDGSSFFNDIWPNQWFLDDVFLEKRNSGSFASSSFASSSVFPQENSVSIGTGLYSSNSGNAKNGKGYVRFPPENRMYGTVYQGSTKSGGGLNAMTVVKDVNCGANYVSPGYALLRNAYVDLTDCQMWLNMEHYYVFNDKTLNQELITRVIDISGKQNHVVGDTPTSNRVFRACRNTLYFNGNDTLDYLSSSIGGTSLFAGAGDDWTVTVACEFLANSYLEIKGNQLGFLLSGGNLYGRCRGTDTLLVNGYTGYNLLTASWDGTTLKYYVGNTEISGLVGSNAENGNNIKFGGNFNGVIGDLRIYDLARTGPQISELYTEYNKRWNFDGAVTLSVPPSAVQNLAATIDGNNDLAVTFTAPASNGGKSVFDYVFRYKEEEEDENFDNIETTSSSVTGFTFPLDVHSGTARVVGGETNVQVYLQTTASTSNSAYDTSMSIKILSGTGAGQIRNIVSYIGTQDATNPRLLTVNSAWSVQPDATSTYVIYSNYFKELSNVNIEVVARNVAGYKTPDSGDRLANKFLIPFYTRTPKIWLDSVNIDSNITYDGGGAVSQWTSRDVVPLDATQSTPSARPLLNVITSNGKQLLSFSASTLALEDLVFSGEFTLFTILKQTSHSINRFYMGHTSQTQKLGTLSTGKCFYRFINAGASDSTVDAPAVNTTHLRILRRDSANKIDHSINNATPTRIFADAAVSGTVTFNKIGGDNLTGLWLGGVGTILGFDFAVPNEELIAYATTLMERFGIT